jgi:hypothetical protein
LWQCDNCQEAFLKNSRLFFKNAWNFKDIFREFEAFLKISILFEDIFREIKAILKVARLFKYIFSGIEASLKRLFITLKENIFNDFEVF